MSAGDPYLVWMASKIREEHGTDQRIAKEMERHARILWVDPPVSLATPARRRFGATRTVRPVLSRLSERVTRLTPAAPPGMTRVGIRATTAPVLRAQVRWVLRRMDIKPFAVVSTNLYDVHGRWGTGVVSALHGADDYVAGAELMGLSASRLRIQEKRAVESADIVTAISPLLADRWAELRGTPVPLIPNGCTPLAPGTSTLPLDLRNLPRPLVGLVGRLNKRIDMDLLEAIVDEGFSLLIVGPNESRWEPQRFDALVSRPKVHYVGRVPEEQAPAYIAATDVGITPYLDSQFNRASFPLKTLDYLSAGRPMVSTDLPAARWLRDDLTRCKPQVAPQRILALADNQDAFIRALRKMVGEPGQPADAGSGRVGAESARAEACQAFAARHTWSRRADALAEAIGLIPEPDRSAAQPSRWPADMPVT